MEVNAFCKHMHGIRLAQHKRRAVSYNRRGAQLLQARGAGDGPYVVADVSGYARSNTTVSVRVLAYGIPYGSLPALDCSRCTKAPRVAKHDYSGRNIQPRMHI
jgi:hypothetical protein